MDLNIDADDLNTCVQCGLCLPHCPTYRVTGDETRSPRGRIALMREVQNHDAPLTREVLESFDTCVQCRGCEPACPSGVPYGHMMESARETLADARKTSPQWLRLGLAPLTHPRLLSAGSTALAVANRAHLVPRRLGLPTDVSIRRERYAPSTTSGPRVWMFTGCVMDSWQRDVHQATKRNLEAAGFNVTPTSDLAPCCGALHAHAGLADTTRNAAVKMMQTLAGSDPIVVDSAGCGAAMKDYGHLLGTTDAAAFAARVFDAQEFIAAHLDRLPTVEALNTVVAIQDPCHLRHVQRVHMATREVLAPVVRHLVELDDEGLCCGAGGAYSLLQPEMATAIRQRKVDTIERAQADVVASANPGCSMHLAAAGVPTRHPMQILDDALRAGAGGHQ